MNRDRISRQQHSRLAYVYVRQSSSYQVMHHQESRLRQRALVDRALELGWEQDRVVLVETDLGHSAARSQKRSGFQQMVARTALGEVGIVLGLEVSRLARGNHDWYHLLDICAITGTLIADGEGLYDPKAYNDRLLLGLKGTMSEAELHILKQRMVEAVRAKAARGEFRLRLPAGYVWDPAGRIQKVADEQVRYAIEGVFERFEQQGTVHRVQCELAEAGLQVPARRGGDRIEWVVPNYGYLNRLLKNPLYAGAYVWGRRQVEESLDRQQRPIKRVRQRPREQWRVLIRDHHEGYITWEQYERNQKQIASNRRGGSQVGAPREGRSLLQGLILCGSCGRRMKVGYGKGSQLIRYRCVSRRAQTGGAACQSFGAIRLERAVEKLLLEALEPLGMEAMIEAADGYLRAGRSPLKQLHQKQERTRYEVDLAVRQYEAVDPANRLVARELERRWEKALAEQQVAEREVEQQLQALETPLTSQQQQQLRDWSQNLTGLWHAPATRVQDKKRILRCLIEQVVVRVSQEAANLQAEVHWVGGEVTPVEVPKGKSGVHRWVSDPELIELVRKLAGEFSDDQIARILSRKKLRTCKGLPFTATRVTRFRYHHGIEGRRRARLEKEDVYTVEQAASILEISRDTVIRWIELGLLEATQLIEGAPWRVQVSEADRARLKATDAPKGWLPLKGAARALGVSQQTVLHRLKSGQLEGVRVQQGARSAWRIRVPSTTYENRPNLFC
jgi:excisionase family DNA binding protein